MKNRVLEFKSSLLVFWLAMALSLTGCAGFGKKLKALINGDTKGKTSARAIASVPKSKRTIRFSENPNVQFNSRRKYRRMTKSKFEQDAKVQGGSGSLWVNEGQGAYWFSENQMRMTGDLLNVKIMGAARDQLETKVKVIKKLLQKLDRPEPSPFRKLAAKKRGKKKKGQKDEEKKEDEDQEESQSTPVARPLPQKEPDGQLSVETVPTRIVDKMPDGNYRVKGSQGFMIGKREYKVIVTGIVRAEDFSDSGIASSSMLDPKYDIVSNRRSFTE